MSPISGISRTISFSDIVATANSTGDKTTLTVVDDAVTKRGTSSFSRFFYSLVDKFSSRHASGDTNSLTAFQTLVARQYGAQALDLLNQQMHVSDERALSAGLVKRSVVFLESNQRDMDFYNARCAVAGLHFFSPHDGQTAESFAKSRVYPLLLTGLGGANPEAFAKAYVDSVQWDLKFFYSQNNTSELLQIFGRKLQEVKAEQNNPPVLAVIKHMEKILHITDPSSKEYTQTMDFRPRAVGEPVRSYVSTPMEVFQTEYEKMADPKTFAKEFAEQLRITVDKEWPKASYIIPQFLSDLTSKASKMDAQGKLIVATIKEELKLFVNDRAKLPSAPRLAMKTLAKGERLGGQPVDGNALRADECHQGINTCFIMSGVLGMLSSTSTKEYLLDRVHIDSQGQYHVKLTLAKCSGHPSFDVEVVVPPKALNSPVYLSLRGSRPEAFAAIECAVANAIQEYGLDSSFSPGSVGYSHLFHSLMGLTEGENMKNFCGGEPPAVRDPAVLRDKLNDLLRNQDTILTLRIHERNHWVSILGVEGDKVRIGNSLHPDKEETFPLAKLLAELQNPFSGYDLIVGHLPRT